MAVFQTIKELLFVPPTRVARTDSAVIPAPKTTYSVKRIVPSDLAEVVRLNYRCFAKGENYSQQTFNYLMNEPNAISYQVRTADNDLAGFVFLIINKDGSAHITTICTAPEHRRRGIARILLDQCEKKLKAVGSSTIVLEVRVSNLSAQSLYSGAGYSIVQRMRKYYFNGEDGFLMMKSLV